jgi:hypothetical protein
MKRFILFITLSFTLLILRPTQGWAVDDFEVVWEHDLSQDDFMFLYQYNVWSHTKIYALSSDVDNFLVYQDFYNSFKVLDLTTGNFIRRIVVDTNLSKFDPQINQYPPDSIGYMQLIENKTKLAVWGSNGYFYIFDTKSWQLIRKVKAKGCLSENGQILINNDATTISVYDFNTMILKTKFSIDKPVTYKSDVIKIHISDDGKRASFDFWIYGFKSIPSEWLLQVYDLETQQRLFKDIESVLCDVFINKDLSKIYIIKEYFAYEYDINNNKYVDRHSICSENDFRKKMSINERYVFCSSSDRISARSLIKTVQIHDWYSDKGNAGFLDAGSDYILALSNITDSSASVLKLKINIEEITPVDENKTPIEVIYPNPTTGNISITINQKLLNGNWILNNYTGNQVKQGLISNIDVLQLNFSDLPVNTYFLTLINGNEKVTYKFIKE